MDKKTLRKNFLKIRGQIPEEARHKKSLIIAEKLFNSEEYKKSGFVFAYSSYGTEAETGDIIKKAFSDGKRIALPVMLEEKGKMAFIEITPKTELVKNKTGIFEPVYDEEKAVTPKKGEVVIVPGAAFTLKGERMGYGGGYYDRYLSRCEAFKIGICFKEQLAEELPQDCFDIKTDTVITD